MRRPVRSALAATVIGLAGALLVAPAASAEVINDLRADVTVNADTTLDVVETIVYDFEGERRHGIFRDIPTEDENASNPFKNTAYDVDITDVTMDGESVMYEVEDFGNALRVKIGDPSRTISDRHEYQIHYTVGGALREVTEGDIANAPAMPADVKPGDVELYWDLIGNEWQVSILNGYGTVLGPAAPVDKNCYTGVYGSGTRCPMEVDGSMVNAGPQRLWPGDALTVSIIYPQDAFTAPVVRDTTWNLGVVFTAGGILLGLIFLIGPALLAFAWRRKDKGAETDLAPPQYGAPDDLRPAELMAGFDGKFASSSQVLVATILDLASRGYVTVTQGESGLLTVTRVNTSTDGLTSWEAATVQALFPSPADVTYTFAEYDPAFTATWKTVETELSESAGNSGRWNKDGNRPDHRWRWLVWIGVGGGIATLLTMFGGYDVMTPMFFIAGMGALIGYVVAREITPRFETPTSATYRAKVRGLKRVLGTDSAAARQEFAQKTGLESGALFATMLPYAVALGVGSQWLGAFPDLTPADFAAHGYYVGSPTAFHHMILGGPSSVSAVSTPPSTSSSSGFSGGGGGGFSGGGGGGGGGGSW